MSLSDKLAAVRATAPTGGKRSHPDHIHFLVSELKSAKGTEGGMSVKSLAQWLTERGYTIAAGQIHGMVYSETAKKSHDKAVARFAEKYNANDPAAIEAVRAIVEYGDESEDAAE